MKQIKDHIANSRTDYSMHYLEETAVDKNPITQFGTWMKEAIDKKVVEPHAMVLSTASADGRPSARILLLRNFSQKGFIFYTNYNSRKGKELKDNPFASITFFWHQMERQIRIEGTVKKQSPSDSDAYFKTRPRESRLGAWTSQQSEVVSSRKNIEKGYKETEEKYKGIEIPRPAYWGGYILKPDRLEFWQGRPRRLHDRLVYTLKSNKWLIKRLAP